jgi:serine/threonine-protein kinase
MSMADSRVLIRSFIAPVAPYASLYQAGKLALRAQSLYTSYHMSQTLRVGAVLRERYEIIDLVGQGGMGAVYKANDRRLSGRICAVKEVLPELISAPGMEDQAQDQFYREASVLARLDHPNLPKVSDYFEQDGRQYLVMDFVPGLDLRQIVDEARRKGEFVPEENVLAWAAQLCEALTYLHTQDPPVLHRDIKPSNIKLTPRAPWPTLPWSSMAATQDTRTPGPMCTRWALHSITW